MIANLRNRSNERLLIINADDFGINQETNQAIIDLFKADAITSASIMMPCPASADAAMGCTGKELTHTGVHLTLTSTENNFYKPLYETKPLASLVAKGGCFHREPSKVEQYADPDEVKAELDTQIQSAISLGIDPTHLDSHAGSILGLSQGRDFLEIAFDLCEQYRIPFNLPIKIIEQPMFSSSEKERFQERIDSAKRRGLVLIDDLVSLPYCVPPDEGYEDMKRRLIQIIRNLRPGITQFTVHPAIITNEREMIAPCYRERQWEYRLLQDRDIKQQFINENLSLVSWRDIRDFQRSL